MLLAQVGSTIMHSPMTFNSSCADACNTLLREHLLAIATYQKAIGSLPLSSRKSHLRRILLTHEKSAEELRATLAKIDARPIDGDAPWFTVHAGTTTIVEDVEGSPDVEELLRREENALNRCDELLSLPSLGKDAIRCIQDTVIPRITKNIAILESLQPATLHPLPMG